MVFNGYLLLMQPFRSIMLHLLLHSGICISSITVLSDGQFAFINTDAIKWFAKTAMNDSIKIYEFCKLLLLPLMRQLIIPAINAWFGYLIDMHVQQQNYLFDWPQMTWINLREKQLIWSLCSRFANLIKLRIARACELSERVKMRDEWVPLEEG